MAKARKLTRRQARENACFLEALGRTGNARLAARELGVNRSTYTKRRARHPAFAADWNAAVKAAHAAFKLAGGRRPPEPNLPSRLWEGPGEGLSQPLRTKGGELTVTRLASGRLQLRRALPGRMTQAAEQAFFRALSASANVRLSAAAAGFAHSSFYARRRGWPAFAEEMKVALGIGYDRLLLASFAAANRARWAGGSAWTDHPEETPIPPMTPDQAIQLLTLHRDTVKLQRERGRQKPIGWEEAATHLHRVIAAIERATHFEQTGEWRLPHERSPSRLPPLEQVTGWSKADPNGKPYHPERALFGGWRIGDWQGGAREQRCRRGASASSERSRRRSAGEAR